MTEETKKDCAQPEENKATVNETEKNGIQEPVKQSKTKRKDKKEEMKEAVNEAVRKAEEEAGVLKDQLMRQMAEFDNFRKRTEKERAGTFDDAKIKTLTPFITVLDGFERAAAAPCTDQTYQEGVMLLLHQFEDALKAQGVEEIPAEGLPLDPARHQAVMQEEQEGVASGCVTKVLQKGYQVGERVLRCAMVAVAK